MAAVPARTAGAALTAVLQKKFARKLKMASDAAPQPIKAALVHANPKNWRDTKKKVNAAKAGLAQDADIADVVTMLDQLDDITDELDDVAVLTAQPAAKDDDMTDMDMTGDGDAEMMAKLKAAFPDMDEAALRKMCDAARSVAMDDDKPKPGETVKPSVVENPVTKAAMDAAIAKVRAETRAETEANVIARLNARADAAAAVRPLVGEVNLAAMDSAEAVYRYALTAKGVPLDGIPSTGFAAVFGAVARAETAPRHTIKPAMDAASAKALEARFPNINRLRG